MDSLEFYGEENFIFLDESFDPSDCSVKSEKDKAFESATTENTKITSPKSKKRNASSICGQKNTRGKFSLRWERDFPWVKADNIDESLGICTVCGKQLVCKRSHLERHEKSYKHQRGMIKKEQNSEKNSPDPKADWSEEEINDLQSLEVDPVYEEVALKSPNIEASTPWSNVITIEDGVVNPEERETKKKIMTHQKILERIDRRRSELNEYYQGLNIKPMAPPTQPVIITPARDSFDLFFDSMSASVKTLPPKLATELKSRISQLVTEFELKAIYEREAAMACNESLLSFEGPPNFQHVTSTTTIDGTGAQIVYTLPIGQVTTAANH